MRKKIVAGNWKMNKTLAQAVELAKEVSQLVKDEVQTAAEVILCPPALYLVPVRDALGANARVKIGAQNCAAYKQGAYTGELAADQIASASIPYTIIGHSERRSIFGETDEMLKSKVDLALENSLSPIFCCGEPLEIREVGTHENLVKNQVTKALFHLDADALQKIVIAYEPVWAIGTGLTASAQQAQDMHKVIRDLLATKYGNAVAESVSILYGGSVKASNAAEIFAMPDVDGGLIGGAALVAQEFVNIVKCA